MNLPKPTATVGPLPCTAGGFFAVPNMDKPIRMTRSSPQRSSFSGSTTSELQQFADKLRNEKLLLKQRKASKNAQPQPRQLSAAALVVSISAGEGRSGFKQPAPPGPGPMSPNEAASVVRPRSVGPAPLILEGPTLQLADSTSSSTEEAVSPKGLNVNAPVFVPSTLPASSNRKASVPTTTTVLPPVGRPFLVGINPQATRRSSLQEVGRSLTDVGSTSKDHQPGPGALIGKDATVANNIASSKNVISAVNSLKIDDVGPLATSGESNGSILPPISPPRISALANSDVNIGGGLGRLESFLLPCPPSFDDLKEQDPDGQCSNLASGSASPADDLSILDDEDEQAVDAVSAQEKSVKRMYDRVDILRIYAQNKGTFPRPNCLSDEFNTTSGVFDPSKWIQHIWSFEQANGISYGTRLTKLPWLSMSTGPVPNGGGFINREDVPKNAQPPMQLLLQQHKKP